MKKTTASEFTVPSLADVDSTYKDLKHREGLLVDKQVSLARERRALEAELGAQPRSAYSASVANLLGEDATNLDSAAGKRGRLVEIAKEERDVEIALSIIKRRIDEQQPVANRLAVDAVRAEYGRRVAGVVAALEVVADARAHYQELIDLFEHQDIRWTSLGPLSLNFLGAKKDGHIDRLSDEARKAGYVE